MALGVSVTLLQQTYAAYFQQTSFSVTEVWAKMHVGAPGKVGTTSPAGNTVRMDASACFGTDPVDNLDGTVSITNDAEIGPWLAVSTSETYTHISLWTDETAGDFLMSGLITSAAVTAGDNWALPIGDLTATSAVAS